MSRMYVVCTMPGWKTGAEFWPLEVVASEGEAQQSIEQHLASFNPEHRDHLLVWSPLLGLTADQADRLRVIIDMRYPVAPLARMMLKDAAV